MNEGGMPKRYNWEQEQRKVDISASKEKILFNQKTSPSREEVASLKSSIEKAILSGQNIKIKYYVYTDKKWIQRVAIGKAEAIDRGSKIMMKECMTFGQDGKPDGEPGDRILYISNNDEFIISAQNE